MTPLTMVLWLTEPTNMYIFLPLYCDTVYAHRGASVSLWQPCTVPLQSVSPPLNSWCSLSFSTSVGFKNPISLILYILAYIYV